MNDLIIYIVSIDVFVGVMMMIIRVVMVVVMMIVFIVMNNYVYFDYLEFNDHGTSRLSH